MHHQPPCSPWRRLATELFEEQGLSAVFTHARNVLTGTLIVAAGLYAMHHPHAAPSFSQWTVHFAGGVVAALGAVLLLLNLCDGLRNLARRQYPWALRAAALFVYVALTVRLVQVIVLFRAVL